MYFRKYTMIYELFFAWQSYKYTVYNGFLCLSSSITHREQQTLYKIVKENICLSFWIYENCYQFQLLYCQGVIHILYVPIFFTPLTVHSIWIKYPYRNKYTYVYVQVYYLSVGSALGIWSYLVHKLRVFFCNSLQEYRKYMQIHIYISLV